MSKSGLDRVAIELAEIEQIKPDLQKVALLKSDRKSDRLTDLSLAVATALDEDPVTEDYNGDYDRKADQFTSDAKARYIVADRYYHNLTSSNMSIYSGTRSVARQAELYIRHTYHGQGNRASWPGCSLHNWGLAADMIRTDETNIVRAMARGGWTRTVVDEGWHFECTGSSDHSKAESKIAEFRKQGSGLAYNWSEAVAKFYRDTKNFNARVTPFNNRLESHRQDSQLLQRDIDHYNSALQALKAKLAKFNSDVSRYNSELQRARNLVDEINNMPGGPDRDRKLREFRRLEAWLGSESDRLDDERAAIQREDNRLSTESAKLDRRIAAYRAEDEWLTNEHKALTNLQKEIDKHKSDARSLLGQISQAAGN